MKRLSCLSFKQGKFKLVSFVIAAKDLYDLVTINRRVEDKRTGYQRALNDRRVATIGRFVDAGNALPTNIVVALDSDKVKLARNGTSIDISEDGDAGWVIDGQHRLAGAHEADSDIQISVTAFLGLDTMEQIQQFITINKEAQKVPTSLYLDLLPDLIDPKRSDAEKAKERAVDISLAMRADEESLFSNRIVALKSPTKGQLSLTNFVRKVAPLVQPNGGILRTHNLDSQRRMLDNYYIALSHIFPKEFSKTDPLFFKTLGFGAFMNAFSCVHDTTFTRTTNDFTIAEIIKTLQPIGDLNLDEFKKAGSGNQAETITGKAIAERISEGAGIGAGISNIKL